MTTCRRVRDADILTMLNFILLGFPIQVHWLFWMMCAVIGGGFRAHSTADWLGVAATTAVIFVSILLHELGHAVAAKRFGCPHPGIVLHGLGGVTIMPNARFSRGQSIIVSLAGPLCGLALGILVMVVFSRVPLATSLAKQTVWALLFVNIVWSLFNLLPILPLDGGQVLRDLLGPKRLNIARWTGAITAGVLGILALLVQQWFIAVFMAVLAYSNFKNRPMQGGVIKP